MIVPFCVCVHAIHHVLCFGLICRYLLPFVGFVVLGSVPPNCCHPLFDFLSTALAPFVVKKPPCRRSRKLQISKRKVVNFPPKRHFFRLPPISEDSKSSVGSNEVIYSARPSVLFIRIFVKVISVLNVMTCCLRLCYLCFCWCECLLV